jgi:hypothetical protein
MSVYVNDTGNSVNVNTTFNTVNVLPDQNSTIIEVITPGPQGAPGEPGNPSLFTSSFVGTASFDAFTSSYYEDSASFNYRINNPSFTGSLFGTASYALNTGLLNGKNSSEFATTGSNIFKENQIITGSISITNQSGTSFFLINTQGTNIIQSNANNILTVKNQNSISLLNVSQSGVILLSTQSIELNSPAPNGGIYFTSSSLFIGID